MRTRRYGSYGLARGGWALVLLSFFVVGAAQAVEFKKDNEFSRKGAYIGIGGHYVLSLIDSDFGELLAFPPAPNGVEDSWGINVRAGRRMNEWFALELAYEWSNPLDIQVSGIVVGNWDPDIVTVNAKAYLPFWRVQPYGLLGGGIGFWDVNLGGFLQQLGDSGSGFAFRGGGGVDVYVTKNIVINAEVTAVLTTGQFVIAGVTRLDKFDYVSAGGSIQYRF